MGTRGKSDKISFSGDFPGVFWAMNGIIPWLERNLVKD
jgi:hypothetical protein